MIFNIEHNIEIKRNVNRFEYVYLGKSHKYIPDFIDKDGFHIEIKGYETELSKIKHASCPNLIVLKSKDLEDVFNYVISKYGKNYINLYE